MGNKLRHNGIDFEREPGQEIVAPVTLKTIRKFKLKTGSPQSGIIWESVKMFYLSPCLGLIGKEVKEGQTIGVSQPGAKIAAYQEE